MSTARLYHFSHPLCKSEHYILELITFFEQRTLMASLRICAGSPEPSLLVYTKFGYVDEDSDQILDLLPCLIGQYGRLNEFFAHMR